MATKKKPGKRTSTKPALKRWNVFAVLQATQHLGEVEAATADEAIEMVSGKAGVTLCYHCSDRVCDGLEVDDLKAEEVV